MKNRQMNLLAALAALALPALNPVSAQAQGGDKTGGGGHLIECLKEGKLKREVLDLHEAARDGRYPNLGSAKVPLEQKIELARAFYAQIDPVRADATANEALKMLADIRALLAGKPTPNHLVGTESPLKLIDDADEDASFKGPEAVLKEGECKRYQFFRQDKPMIGSIDPRYRFDPKVWALVEDQPDQLVGILYHESVYKEFRDQDIRVSKAARKLVSLIVSGQVQKLSSSEYRQFLQDQGLRTYLLAGQFEAMFKVSTLDSQGEIVGLTSALVGGVYHYRLGKVELPVLDPVFSSSREFVSARLSGDYSVPVDPRAGQFKTARIHEATVRVLPESRLAIEGRLYQTWGDATSDVDAGRIRITVDAEGRTLSREEDSSVTGLFQAQWTPELRELETDLLKCVRKNIKHGNRLDLLLERSRHALLRQSATELRQVITDCRDRKEPAQIIPVSNETNVVLDWIRNPRTLSCTEGEGLARLSVGIGVAAGFGRKVCQRSNGKRRIYVGPRAGLGFGLGASVHVGEMIESGNDGNADAAGIAFNLNVQENNTVLGTDHRVGEGPMRTRDKVPGTSMGGEYDFVSGAISILIQVGAKDNFEPLLNQIGSHLVAPQN